CGMIVIQIGGHADEASCRRRDVLAPRAISHQTPPRPPDEDAIAGFEVSTVSRALPRPTDHRCEAGFPASTNKYGRNGTGCRVGSPHTPPFPRPPHLPSAADAPAHLHFFPDNRRRLDIG